MGRPKANIDPAVVEAMAYLGSSNREIARYFGCDEKTIRSRFPAEIAKGDARGCYKLRQLQDKLAEGGNCSMLIFLGKQRLGQSDKLETKNDQTVIIKEKAIDTSPKIIEDRLNSTAPVGSN